MRKKRGERVRAAFAKVALTSQEVMYNSILLQCSWKLLINRLESTQNHSQRYRFFLSQC